MSGYYRENRGWQGKLLRNTQGRAALRLIANDYKESVPGNDPVRTGWLQEQYEKTGRVRSGHLTALGAPSMEYWTGVPIWHIIEYGSINNPPYSPLRRTADEMGLEWEGK